MTQSTENYEKQCKAIARMFHRGDATGPIAQSDPGAAHALRQQGWQQLADVFCDQIDNGGMKRSEVMDRPATLPPSDRKLLARVNKLRKQKRQLSNTDKEFMREYGAWVDDVMRSEGQNLGCVHALLNMLARLDSDDSRAERIRLFLQTEFEWAGPDPLPLDQVNIEAIRLCRTEEVLPTWVIKGEQPPGEFVPDDFGEDESEDDDAPNWMQD